MYKRWAVSLFLLSIFPAAYGRVVTAATTILIDNGEPAPLQKAASDLADDFQRVFGQRAKIVHTQAEAGASVIWIALDRNVPKQVAKPAGWEFLHIQTLPNGIALTGSDMRGAMYAVYQFSQQFLGVDPLYWWTDHAPARRAEASVPDGFSMTEGPARFTPRGWFLNDGDLFTGWKPGTTDGTGISLALWDHIFEAILRLKGDMVVPGTWIFPYEPQIRAAGDRGLIVTQHHVNTLGLDTYRWPKAKLMSYLSDPKSLESAWKIAANQYPKNTEILWSVGFRGQNDYPFWQDDPNSPTTDEGRAKIIRAAIDKQIEIVHSQYHHPEILMNAWREAATFIHEGVLKIPDEATLIWADNGHGLLDDRGAIAKGQGEYYHTAMYDYMSNHYSEMVPLERIPTRTGTRWARAGATRWLLVNTANVRPVVMTTRAVFELAWKPDSWVASNSTESSNYLDKWSKEEFGEAAAPAVAAYYKAYFQAPAKYGPAEDAIAGDNPVQSPRRGVCCCRPLKAIPPLLTRLNNRIPHKDLNDFLAAKLLDAGRAADVRWERARAMAGKARLLVPKDRLDFFQANVLTQVDLHTRLNRMVMNLAEAQIAPGKPAKIAKVQAAIKEGQAAIAAIQAAEYGKWKGLYTEGDWLLDTPRTLALARTYIDFLEGRPVSENAVIRAKDTGFAYFRITAYQGTQAIQF